MMAVGQRLRGLRVRPLGFEVQAHSLQIRSRYIKLSGGKEE